MENYLCGRCTAISWQGTDGRSGIRTRYSQLEKLQNSNLTRRPNTCLFKPGERVRPDGRDGMRIGRRRRYGGVSGGVAPVVGVHPTPGRLAPLPNRVPVNRTVGICRHLCKQWVSYGCNAVPRPLYLHFYMVVIFYGPELVETPKDSG